MIGSIALPSSASCEEFLNIIKTVNKMAQLGLEFCGSNSSALLSCLAERSKSYFSSMHNEAMQVLRLMVDSESWEIVNINLNDVGGVLGILKKSVIVSSRRKSKTVKKRNADSILVSFAKYGNPFLSESETEGDVEKDNVINLKSKLRRVDEEEEEEEEGSSEKGSEKYNVIKNNKNNTVNEIKENEIENEVEVDEDVEDEVEIGFGSSSSDRFNLIAFDRFMCNDGNDIQISTSTSTSTSIDIITQTSLNGLARYTGRYLQLMFLLPSIAPDIFTALCSLFDFYLYSVYSGFMVPEKQTILKKYKLSKTTAPAPDKMHETEVNFIFQFYDFFLNFFFQIFFVSFLISLFSL